MKKFLTVLAAIVLSFSVIVTFGCKSAEHKIKDKIDEYKDDVESDVTGTNTGGTNNIQAISFSRVVEASSPIVGDWGTGVTSTSTFALSFYPNGYYVMWDKGASAGTGLEYGTYSASYSGSTITITATSIVDDQGDNPADLAGACGLTSFAGHTVVINLKLVDQNTIQVVGYGEVTLHRAVDANNPIVGSWGSGRQPDSPNVFVPLMIVFYPNGTYIHFEQNANNPSQIGAEYGTYLYDISTVTATTIEDRNGDIGLGNGNGATTTFHISSYGNTLTFYE